MKEINSRQNITNKPDDSLCRIYYVIKKRSCFCQPYQMKNKKQEQQVILDMTPKLYAYASNQRQNNNKS